MSRRLLLDVNVLVALAWPNHVHHAAAQNWFAVERPAWASSPMTQCGFVRISSNPRFVATAVGPRDAIRMLDAMTQTGDHQFFSDAVPRVAGGSDILSRLTGHRQVTDAHLLAVALSHHGALATFDRAIQALASSAEDVVVVPA